LLSSLYTRNAVAEYVLNYYQKNRKKLESMTLNEFKSSFLVTDKMLNDLVQVGISSGVSYSEKDFLKSKELLRIQLKAQLARRLWDNHGFYSIFNETNESYKKAMTLFDQAEVLAQSYR
jgi:carboxyl-terminal processing protease